MYIPKRSNNQYTVEVAREGIRWSWYLIRPYDDWGLGRRPPLDSCDQGFAWTETGALKKAEKRVQQQLKQEKRINDSYRKLVVKLDDQ